MQHTRTQRSTHALLAAKLAITLAATALSGCGSSSKSAMQPDDFISQDAVSSTTDSSTQTTENTSTSDVTTPKSSDDTTVKTELPNPKDTSRDPANGALAINAMVGHINGEAVYADQIFNIDVAAQLEAYGRRFDDNEFNQQAAGVIQERLRSIIIDKLILGEAERFLKTQQRSAIDARVKAEREEILRFYGQGSIAKAKAEFLKARGMTFDRHLSTFREELSIQWYVQSKVLPKIVVNQRDVERYYQDNKDDYIQPSSRVIRIIRTPKAETAQLIEKRLAKGETFKALASDASLNIYNAAGTGLFSGGESLPGDNIYGVAPVNDALLKLEEGEHSGAILAGKNYYFVEVVKFTQGNIITLNEAQLKIEQQLRALQFETHVRSFRMDLLDRGSYTPLSEMGEKLIEIAYARYDK